VLRASAIAFGLLAIGGQLGRWSPWFDVVNSIAPLTLTASLAILLIALAFRRSERMAIAAALVGVAGSAERVLPELAAESPPVSRAGFAVTIVTHNVRVDNRDPLGTVAMLAGSGADIMLLQETDGSVAGAIPRLAAHYPYSTPCRQARCAMIILSRWPIRATRYRIRDAEGRQIGPPLIWATIAPPGGPPFTVATHHLPWPLPPRDQHARRAALVRALPGLDTRTLILAGDFNLTPWSFAMAELDRGMAPLRRATRALPSFPARFGGGNRALPVLPIDHVFIGPGWSVARVERLPATGSDHFPVRVRLVANSGQTLRKQDGLD
jgi:vancomycin resistance protein VanJ